MGFYLGSAIGVILALLIIRYVTATRFIIALCVLTGVVITAMAGFFLAYPVRGYFDPSYGALVGAVVGVAIFSYSLYGRASYRHA